MEYFDKKEDALLWIGKQPQPKRDEYQWLIGEY